MKRWFVMNLYSRSALPEPGSPLTSPSHFPIKGRSDFQGSAFSADSGNWAPSIPRTAPQPKTEIRIFRIVVFIRGASYRRHRFCDCKNRTRLERDVWKPGKLSRRHAGEFAKIAVEMRLIEKAARVCSLGQRFKLSLTKPT